MECAFFVLEVGHARGKKKSRIERLSSRGVGDARVALETVHRLDTNSFKPFISHLYKRIPIETVWCDAWATCVKLPSSSCACTSDMGVRASFVFLFRRVQNLGERAYNNKKKNLQAPKEMVMSICICSSSSAVKLGGCELGHVTSLSQRAWSHPPPGHVSAGRSWKSFSRWKAVIFTIIDLSYVQCSWPRTSHDYRLLKGNEERDRKKAETLRSNVYIDAYDSLIDIFTSYRSTKIVHEF